MTVMRRDGSPDLRYAHPGGMRVGGIKVDHFAPKPVCGVCAWADRNHRQPFPHTYRNAPHCWMRAAA